MVTKKKWTARESNPDTLAMPRSIFISSLTPPQSTRSGNLYTLIFICPPFSLPLAEQYMTTLSGVRK